MVRRLVVSTTALCLAPWLVPQLHAQQGDPAGGNARVQPVVIRVKDSSGRLNGRVPLLKINDGSGSRVLEPKDDGSPPDVLKGDRLYSLGIPDAHSATLTVALYVDSMDAPPLGEGTATFTDASEWNLSIILLSDGLHITTSGDSAMEARAPSRNVQGHVVDRHWLESLANRVSTFWLLSVTLVGGIAGGLLSRRLGPRYPSQPWKAGKRSHLPALRTSPRQSCDPPCLVELPDGPTTPLTSALTTTLLEHGLVLLVAEPSSPSRELSLPGLSHSVKDRPSAADVLAQATALLSSGIPVAVVLEGMAALEPGPTSSPDRPLLELLVTCRLPLWVVGTVAALPKNLPFSHLRVRPVANDVPTPNDALWKLIKMKLERNDT